LIDHLGSTIIRRSLAVVSNEKETRLTRGWFGLPLGEGKLPNGILGFPITGRHDLVDDGASPPFRCCHYCLGGRQKDTHVAQRDIPDERSMFAVCR